MDYHNSPPPFHRCVLVMHAREATQSALSALRVNFTWWGTLSNILLATAIIFPLLTLAAVGVSAWRALLAHQLNIHAPDAAWRRRSKAYQVGCVWRGEGGGGRIWWGGAGLREGEGCKIALGWGRGW
jgi:hypothetical protein